LLAGAELNLSSPAVATLSDSVQAGVGDISDGVNALLGPEGAIQGALDGVAIDPIEVGIDLPLLDTLLTVDLGAPELNASVDLSQVTEGLLDEPLVSDNGLVTIDLDSGIVNVDLAMLHQGDLNGLPANTELLSAQEIAQIVQTVNELLYEVLDLVTDAVTETLETTELTITLDPTLTAGAGLVGGDLDVSLAGTLAQFTGQSAEAPDVDVSGSITIIGIPVPVGDIVGAVVEPVLAELVPQIGSALSPLLDDASGVVADAIEPLIDALTDTLDPVFTDVLNEIASVTVNKQEDGADVEDWHSVSALNLVVLPLLNDAVELDLAHSAVRALQEDVVEIGDDFTVYCSRFTPDSTAEVTFTDSEGNEVGTQQVDTDENGEFTTNFTIPEGTEFGDLEVTADDGDNQATGTTAVIESDDGTDEDGSDEDGTDEDGSDDDGTDEEGTEEDGTDDEGTEEEGTEEDGTDDDDSADEDGADEVAADDAGTYEDEADEDGTDEDGTDEDGTDEDGTDDDGTDDDGADQDGTEQDGSDDDGSDDDGSDEDGTDED